MFDPSLPWKWWRHMWMTLILLNLEFVTWIAFNFLWKHIWKSQKFDLDPISLDCLAWLGAFTICIYDLSMCEFDAFIIIYQKNIFWQFLSHFDIFLPSKNISSSSRKTNLIKSMSSKKENNLQNETMNPSFQKERKKLL